LIFLGFLELIKKHKKTKIRFAAIFLLGFLLLFENFPSPLKTGRLREHNETEKALYAVIDQFPDHYGVLELPHFRGFGDNKIFSLYTIYHDKHVYNGFYGVGIFDPLKIFKQRYFHPVTSIPEDINDPSILRYLRENGIRIIVFHRSLMIFGEVKGQQKFKVTKKVNQWWGDIVGGFKKAKERGLLQELDILDNGIIAVINEDNKAMSFKFQFTYHYMKSKKHMVMNLKKFTDNPVKIKVFFNRELIFETPFVEPFADIKVKLPQKAELRARGNYFEIQCSEEVSLEKIDLIK
jgi:hypothetical protein